MTRDEGAAAVEFALLLPVIALMLFGMIDLGVWLNTKITATESARQAVRAYALATDDDDREDEAKKIVTDAMGGAPANYTWRISGCQARPGSTVRTAIVDFTYRAKAAVGIIPGMGTLNISGKAVMPCTE